MIIIMNVYLPQKIGRGQLILCRGFERTIMVVLNACIISDFRVMPLWMPILFDMQALLASTGISNDCACTCTCIILCMTTLSTLACIPNDHPHPSGITYMYVIVIWQASALYWPKGPIECCACHITDLLDVDIGI